jgi:hypothetical protein
MNTPESQPTFNPLQALVDIALNQPAKKAKAVRPRTARKEGAAPSKRELAKVLYKTHIAEGRNAVLKAFKTQLNMTDAGSNSYYYATKKALS